MHPTTRFTYLALVANGLIDRGEEVEVDAMRRHLRDKDLFTWLASMFPGEIDLGFYTAPEQAHTGAEVLEVLHDLEAGTDSSRLARKFWVENKGLCLLVAFCIEGVQMATTGDWGV